MSFGVAHYVQVNKFFELERGGLHVFDDIHEEHWYIFTSSHGIDDSPDGLLFSCGIDIVEFGSELCDLSSFLCHWDLIF